MESKNSTSREKCDDLNQKPLISKVFDLNSPRGCIINQIHIVNTSSIIKNYENFIPTSVFEFHRLKNPKIKIFVVHGYEIFDQIMYDAPSKDDMTYNNSNKINTIIRLVPELWFNKLIQENIVHNINTIDDYESDESDEEDDENPSYNDCPLCCGLCKITADNIVICDNCSFEGQIA